MSHTTPVCITHSVNVHYLCSRVYSALTNTYLQQKYNCIRDDNWKKMEFIYAMMKIPLKLHHRYNIKFF